VKIRSRSLLVQVTHGHCTAIPKSWSSRRSPRSLLVALPRIPGPPLIIFNVRYSRTVSVYLDYNCRRRTARASPWHLTLPKVQQTRVQAATVTNTLVQSPLIIRPIPLISASKRPLHLPPRKVRRTLLRVFRRTIIHSTCNRANRSCHIDPGSTLPYQ